MNTQRQSTEGDRLLADAMAIDPAFGARLREWMRGRTYGLVFEHNRPEEMTLTGKPPAVGDTVRAPDVDGVATIVGMDGGRATLEDGDGNEVGCDAAALTPVVDWSQPVYAGLKPLDEPVLEGGDAPHHVVIEGENLHALQMLRYPFGGRVDCIYIDPPYNTGARDWKYDNDYVDGNDTYRHSKWLAFMERRLKLALDLLRRDRSVLICTIDEKEYARLALLLEQVCDDAHVEYSIQMVTSVINPKGVARAGQFSRVEEYVFFVWIGAAKPESASADMLSENGGQWDEKVPWLSMLRRGTSSSRDDSPGCFYPIFVDESTATIREVGEPLDRDADRRSVLAPLGTVAVWPLHGDGSEGRWQIGRPRLMKALSEGWARLGRKDPKSGQWAMNYLNQGTLDEIDRGDIEITGRDDKGAWTLRRTRGRRTAAKSVWMRKSHDASTYGTSLLKRLLPDTAFSYPKSLYAVEDCLRFAVGGNPDAVVLDFFAGSGTTAHAVMRLNAEDGGRRRSISVTNNEVGPRMEAELAAKGLKPGDPDWERRGICRSVTIPRIRAAITGRTPDGAPVKGRYRFGREADMSDGLRANASFYRLVYLDERDVEDGYAFEALAPVLWMRAGQRGRLLEEDPRGWDATGSQAILFSYARWRPFVEAVFAHPDIAVAYIVTDDPERMRRMRDRLPGIEAKQLYESYLDSFSRLTAEGRAA